MKIKNLDSFVEEEVDKFENLSEDEQIVKQAEYIGKLIEMLPDPNNEEEFDEFVRLYKNPPITGNTDEERALSFLELAKTNPKFFSQCIALSSLSSDLSSLEEIAKENSNNVPKQASVSSISKEELQKIKDEDKQSEIQKEKDILASIPVDE